MCPTTMCQRVLWDRAEECARAIQATSDPKQRELLTRIQDLWITLANDSRFMSAARLSDEMAAIGRIHAELMVSTLHSSGLGNGQDLRESAGPSGAVATLRSQDRPADTAAHK